MEALASIESCTPFMQISEHLQILAIIEHVSDKSKELKYKPLGSDTFHCDGGLPREGVGVKKLGMFKPWCLVICNSLHDRELNC